MVTRNYFKVKQLCIYFNNLVCVYNISVVTCTVYRDLSIGDYDINGLNITNDKPKKSTINQQIYTEIRNFMDTSCKNYYK